MDISLKHCHTIVLDDDPLIPKVLEKVTGIKTVAYSCPKLFMSNLRRHKPIAVFVDIHLGEEKITGLELLPQLRARFPHVPILILTSDPSDEALVTALSNGADDFLRKPIKASELTARLRTRLKDTSDKEKNSVIRFGDICLDPVRGRLRGNGKERFLSPLLSKILQCLMDAKGTHTTRELLKENAWGTMRISENALDRKISEIRKVLLVVSKSIELTTMYGKGFTLQRKSNQVKSQ